MKAWKEECGVLGIWNDPEAARATHLGLFAMQHRGQESAGIVSLENQTQFIFKGLGLVEEVFSEETLAGLPGRAAIGHVRYSTTGQNLIANAQPLQAQLFNGPVAIAHNGNLVNASELRGRLQESGSIFHGSNDTEMILHLIAKSPTNNLIQALRSSLAQVVGAYSLVLLSHDKMVAVRDPQGFRPLVLGEKVNSLGEKVWVVASETCAFDLLGVSYVREIEPGEIFWVDSTGAHSEKMLGASTRKAQCIFEHVYFSRPDSVVFGQSVYESRKKFGALLAKETPVKADIVIPVPDSGVPAAIGFSAESKIPFELGIIRNHYIGRTFIQPQQSIRDLGVKIKLNPQPQVLAGKSVVVIDDSLVRGTTSKKIISLIRAAGAREVHMRIAAPPTISPCFYGVDTPRKSELIASRESVENIRKYLDADSLAYLSLEGLFKAMGEESNGSFCAACFDGKYPTELFGLEKTL